MQHVLQHCCELKSVVARFTDPHSNLSSNKSGCFRLRKVQLQKVESSFSFWNKICICCSLYRPKAPGGTSLQEANGDVPLDGVAFSIELLEWGRKFSDIWGK